MSLPIFCVLVFTTGVLSLSIDLSGDIYRSYEESRALLTPSEEKLLTEILAADDILLERQKRGIIDRTLATLAGLGGAFPLFGPGPARTETPVLIPGPGRLESINVNGTIVMMVNNSTEAGRSPNSNSTTENPYENHLFSQISKVIMNSATRNVSGIVDESLKIAAPAPIRNLVNSIMGVVYCNGIRRLLGRC